MVLTPNPTASTTPTPLSFPALTFAKLSPTAFLHAHLTSPSGPTRPSHRAPSRSRIPTIHTGSLTHADGSAVVRVGDTAAVCGVRAEILLVRDVADYQPRREGPTLGDEIGGGREGKRRNSKEESQEMARLNLLVPNLELATGCSPAYMPGGPPSTLAQTLSQRLVTLLHISNLVDMEDLRIWYHPPKLDSGNQIEQDSIEDEEDTRPTVRAFWTLYIDILFISLDGNPFDAAWGAMLAALQDVRLPKAWWDADRDMVLCDADAALSKPLRLRGLPVAASYVIFSRPKDHQKWTLADPDGFEEGVCEDYVSVVVRKRDGEQKWDILALESSAGIEKGAEEIFEIVKLAEARWKDWAGVLLRQDGGVADKAEAREGDEKARKRKETEERVRKKMEQLGMPPLKPRKGCRWWAKLKVPAIDASPLLRHLTKAAVGSILKKRRNASTGSSS